MCPTIHKLNTVTDPIIDKAIILPKCEMGLNNSSLFLVRISVLVLSESDEYPVIGPFWTLIRYGSLFICPIPLLDDEDDNTSNVATIA